MLAHSLDSEWLSHAAPNACRLIGAKVKLKLEGSSAQACVSHGLHHWENIARPLRQEQEMCKCA